MDIGDGSETLKRKYTRQEARSTGCLSWGLFLKGPLFRPFFWRGNFAAFYCWFLHRDEGCCWPQISPFFSFPDALLEVFTWTIFNLSTAPSCSSLFISGKHLKQSLRSGSPAPSCAFVDLPVKMLSAYYCWRPVYDGYECLQLLEQNGGFGNSAAQPPMQIQNLHNNAGNVCFQTVCFLVLETFCMRCSLRGSNWILIYVILSFFFCLESKLPTTLLNFVIISKLPWTLLVLVLLCYDSWNIKLSLYLYFFCQRFVKLQIDTHYIVQSRCAAR